MPSLTYVAPTTVSDAVKILAAASGPTRVMSGGTDLLVQLRSGRTKPDLIVDTKKIPGIIGITQNADGGFTIGAATSGALLGEHAALKAAYPGIVEAAQLIGSTQVQGRASLAGNLCNASPAADSVPAMIAARAICVVVGPNGKREVPVEAARVKCARSGMSCIQAAPTRPSSSRMQKRQYFLLKFTTPRRRPSRHIRS